MGEPCRDPSKSHDDHDNFDGHSHLSPAQNNYNNNPQAFPYLTDVNCIKIGRLLQSKGKFNESIWATGKPYQDFIANYFPCHH